MILSVWSLTENQGVLNQIAEEGFGLTRVEVTGRWRNLDNEDPREWYPWLLINTEDELGGAHGMNGREENMFTFSVSKFEGKRQLGSSRCRWENYIQMYLKNSIGMCGLDAPDIWIYEARA